MGFNEIKQMAEAQQDYMIRMRRHFHSFPEVSNQEFETSNFIAEELNRMGVPYERIDGTGIIAAVEGKKPGRNRLLRCDMDALPVKEDVQNLKGPKACISQKEGVCHACGHDAHMAMMLGTIRVLLQIKDQIEGTVYCCFEEGEESTTGVVSMMKALEHYTVDECFALHVYNALEAGKINIVSGSRMAGAVGFGIHVKGRGGHGSRPDLAANPIVPAAHIVTEMDSALRNQINAEATVTFGLCIFQTGELWNVIPETAYLSGTSRYFDKESGEVVLSLIKQTSECVAKCHGCSVEYEPCTKIILEPVINDPGVAERVHRTLGQIWGENVFCDCDRWYASETFCKYLNRYPGVLGFLGIRNEELGSGAAHHNSRFDLDESVMPLGVCAEVAFVLG